MVKRLFLIVSIAVLAVSCESEYQTTLVDQENFIDKYIASQFADNTVIRNEGVNRVIIKEGSGPTIEKGDQVSFYYVGYVLTAQGPSMIFTADQTTVTIGEGDLIKGLDIGLVGARKGEESCLIFTADYGYGKNSVNIVPETSALFFQTVVKYVQKNKN